jgi:hypothetical protein
MTLIDQPDPTQQHLIDVVARGFREAGNQWPILQYVEAQLDEWFTSEATDVLRSCPRLTFGTSVGSYGWFRLTGQQWALQWALQDSNLRPQPCESVNTLFTRRRDTTTDPFDQD